MQKIRKSVSRAMWLMIAGALVVQLAGCNTIAKLSEGLSDDIGLISRSLQQPQRPDIMRDKQ